MPLARPLLFLTALATLTATQPAQAGTQTLAFNDTQFDVTACEIRPDRSAVCRFTVTNRYRNKGIEVWKGITLQDNHGTDYPVTAGGFGEPSSRPQWTQLAVADTSYSLTVVATNLSTRATAIRAIVFPRFLLRSTQGQAIAYRDKVIFAHPPMVAANSPQPASTNTTANTTTAPATQTVATPSATATTAPHKLTGDVWHVVGYWDYDAADGQHLAGNGLVLRQKAGAGLGQRWQAHLELKNHGALPPRQRALWPVKINTAIKKVCADYPGYPTYPAFIDLPGEREDGVYQVGNCSQQRGERGPGLAHHRHRERSAAIQVFG